MDPDPVELEKRKINASAYALDALAAFARFRTSLPLDMSAEERAEKFEEWAKTAVLVVFEQIDELEAYSKTNATYSTAVAEFTANMSVLALMELLKVMPYDAMINYFSEYFSCGTLQEIKDRHEKVCHGIEDDQATDS